MRVTRRRSRLAQTGTEYMLLVSVLTLGILYATYSFVQPFKGGVDELGKDVRDILMGQSIGGVGRSGSRAGAGNGGIPGTAGATPGTAGAGSTGTGNGNGTGPLNGGSIFDPNNLNGGDRTIGSGNGLPPGYNNGTTTSVGPTTFSGTSS